ncbi:MAG: hypothetical protein H6993_10110 [Pseudomonadales bacterium]|nr:hypothetical protein [Pseudomonadales bacterium]
MMYRRRSFLLVSLLLAICGATHAAGKQAKQCGEAGVWVEILGAGSGELTQDFNAPSYLVWVDDRARVLVDAGDGSTGNFVRAGGRFEDLDAVVFTTLEPHVTSALPAYIAGSLGTPRDRTLPLFGPEGNAGHAGMTEMVQRLFGEGGVYPSLGWLFTTRSASGYRVTATDIPVNGNRRWARFGSDRLRLSAIPMDHGDTPSLAWRVDAGEISIVFAGPFVHAKQQLVEFAKGADALVVTHAIREITRGDLRDAYAPPSKLGEVAAEAGVRTLVLGARADRTRGRETESREAITGHFDKYLIFANDMECWGF